MIIKYVKTLWEDYGLLTIITITIIFLLYMWLTTTRNKESGTYNKMSITNYFKMLLSEESKQKVPGVSKIKESKGEAECRRVMQKIFNVPFPNSRPDFLFNSVTGHNLELDMFNPHLKIACEYNGKQHYHFNKWMHNNSKTNFYNMQYRDNMKRDVCKKLGIFLLEVPYTIPIADIESFIISKLKNKNLIK
jgi:hypothetical protein